MITTALLITILTRINQYNSYVVFIIQKNVWRLRIKKYFHNFHFVKCWKDWKIHEDTIVTITAIWSWGYIESPVAKYIQTLKSVCWRKTNIYQSKATEIVYQHWATMAGMKYKISFLTIKVLIVQVDMNDNWADDNV